MLRRLIIMRHAKSSWKSKAPDDHSRPLNKRGQRDTPLIAQHIRELGWSPEVILTSDATRTLQTSQLMVDHFQPSPIVHALPSLYLAGIHDLREAVAVVDSDFSTVIVLGHNPGWQQAVTWLTDEHVDMRTANAALLQSESDSWREAMHGERIWQFVDVLRPKELLRLG